MRNLLFIILFLLGTVSNTAEAQLVEFADSEVVRLRSQGIDTVICFSFPTGRMTGVKSLGGIGQVSYFSIDYLFYKKGNIVYSTQSVVHCNTDCSNTILSESKPLKVEGQQLFDFLSVHFEKMKGENIYPGIVKIASPDSTEMFYRDYRSFHETEYRIRVFTKESNLTRTINPADIIEFDGRAGRENLNYRYNTGTKLYAFYSLMLELCESLDKDYKF